MKNYMRWKMLLRTKINLHNRVLKAIKALVQLKKNEFFYLIIKYRIKLIFLKFWNLKLKYNLTKIKK